MHKRVFRKILAFKYLQICKWKHKMVDKENHFSGFVPVKYYCALLAAVAGDGFLEIQTGMDAFYWISLLCLFDIEVLSQSME